MTTDITWRTAVRSLMLDELTTEETAAVRTYLEARADFSGVKDLYWLKLPRDLWAERQIRASESGMLGAEAFRLAVEIGAGWVRFELLVRSETLANTGGGQANLEQALYVLKWADSMACELGLFTCTDPAPLELETPEKGQT